MSFFGLQSCMPLVSSQRSADQQRSDDEEEAEIFLKARSDRRKVDISTIVERHKVNRIMLNQE